MTDCLMDWHMNLMMYGWTFTKFGPGVLIAIFTMDFADGWMDRMDDR